MELTDAEVRVLGCLIEKELTTPDHYPLTTNALVAACNQKSNRDPVVEYDERTVDTAMLSLREQGLARTITGSGRALKHRQVLAEALQLDEAALAVLGVLAVRGPQTVGELRTRTDRAHAFADLGDVGAVLEQLASRAQPLVVDLGRRPGQKEDRWAHLLSGEVADSPTPSLGAAPSPQAAPPAAVAQSRPQTRPDRPDEIAELRNEIGDLRAQIAALYALLGEEPPSGST